MCKSWMGGEHQPILLQLLQVRQDGLWRGHAVCNLALKRLGWSQVWLKDEGVCSYL